MLVIQWLMTIDIKTLTGLSGAELNRRTGLAESLFSRIAKGERAITVSTALLVSKHTDVPLSKLLTKAQLKEYGLN